MFIWMFLVSWLCFHYCLLVWFVCFFFLILRITQAMFFFISFFFFLCVNREETVSQLLSNMFDSNKNESVLVNGLCVIHTLLEIRKQGYGFVVLYKMWSRDMMVVFEASELEQFKIRVLTFMQCSLLRTGKVFQAWLLG